MQQLPDNFNLTSFINESKNRLSAILERLQWSEEYVLPIQRKDNETKDQCEDMTCDELPLPESCTSTSSTNSVTLDVNELRQLVDAPFVELPVRFSDLQVNFSREQKLRIYEHIVQCTGKCTEPEAPDSVAFGEIVAAKKREKKNKRRHRISRPTHIEEVRGLVELQMQSLQQYVDNQREEEGVKRRTQRHRSQSRERQQMRRNSRSRSRSRHRHKSHKRRESRHSSSHESKQQSREHKKQRSRSRGRNRESKRHTHQTNRSRSRECKQHKHKRVRSRSHERRHTKHSQSSKSRR